VTHINPTSASETVWPCGCVVAILDGARSNVCRTHTISPLACCEQAKPFHCVCYSSFSCPVHGTKHIGTHD
jgi:hypothetical protein